MIQYSSPKRSLAAVGTAVLAWSLILSSTHAEIAPPYPVLLKEALVSAPRIAESQADVAAARGSAQQAAAWRNPSLSIDAENFNAERGSNAYDGRQTTYSLSQPFELGGKRQARRAAANAEVTLAEANARQSQVALAAELATAYAEAEGAQARLKVYQDDLQRATEDLTAAQALTDAGKEASLRVNQAQAALASTNANVEAARAEVTAALANLSALAGRMDGFTDITPILLTSSQTRITVPVISLDQSPTVLAARAERDASAALVQVEKRRVIPDLDLSVGVRQFPGQSSGTMVAGMALPLPLFDRNRGGVATAEARKNAADARLRSTEAIVAAGQRVAVAQASASDQRLKAATDARNYAAEAYRLARIGYDAGKTPLLELLGTRRALAEAELTLINTRLDRARAVIALARTNGQIAYGDL